MERKYTRRQLKRLLTNTLKKVELLKDPKVALTPKENKTLLANQRVIDQLNEALELFDKNFNRSCELICEIPYQIVSPSPKVNIKKYPIIGSNEVYSRTDTLRHYVRMLPETDFENSKIWNNVLVLS